MVTINYARYNEFFGNTFKDTTINVESLSYSIIPRWSKRNRFWRNSFLSNTNIFVDYGTETYWDNGYPNGGNYWFDYEVRYPNAIELNGSGIWDIPYVIDGSNKDNYPLIPELPSLTFVSFFITIASLVILVFKKKMSCNFNKPETLSFD